jgi:signal transduction histidine kinase
MPFFESLRRRAATPGAVPSEEEQRRDSMRRFLLERLPGVLWTTDADLLVTSSYSTSGWTDPEGTTGKTLWEVFRGEPELEVALDAHQRALAGEVVPYELTAHGRHFIAQLEPQVDPEGRIVGTVGVALDVTRYWEAQQENARLFTQVEASRSRLRQLSKQLITAQETERRTLARRLHDDVGQSLTAVGLLLQTLTEEIRDPAAAERLQQAREITRETLDHVRVLSVDLRPPMLDQLGLVATLRWYVNRIGTQGPLSTHFSATPPDLQLSAEVETTCFRLAQEAMTNVVRHSEATAAHVSLQHLGDVIELQVTDNGRGFDVAAARERSLHGNSLGVLTMQEQAELTGGQLNIESRPGFTQISVSWPCSVAGAEAP